MAADGRKNADDGLAAALAAGQTLCAAAAAGVSERTARRRWADAAFRRRVSVIRGEMIGQAIGRVAETMSAAPPGSGGCSNRPTRPSCWAPAGPCSSTGCGAGSCWTWKSESRSSRTGTQRGNPMRIKRRVELLEQVTPDDGDPIRTVLIVDAGPGRPAGESVDRTPAGRRLTIAVRRVNGPFCPRAATSSSRASTRRMSSDRLPRPPGPAAPGTGFHRGRGERPCDHRLPARPPPPTPTSGWPSTGETRRGPARSPRWVTIRPRPRAHPDLARPRPRAGGRPGGDGRGHPGGDRPPPAEGDVAGRAAARRGRRGRTAPGRPGGQGRRPAERRRALLLRLPADTVARVAEIDAEVAVVRTATETVRAVVRELRDAAAAQTTRGETDGARSARS